MATAVCFSPAISRNGASSAGLGLPVSDDHTLSEIPTLQLNWSPLARTRTFLIRSPVDATTDRAVDIAA